MDHIDHQKYVYVHYHLKSLLREWKKLKPSLEAKLTAAYRTNPYAKYILCLRVWQFNVRIYDANLELYRLLNHIYYSFNHNLSARMLLRKPNMGFALYNFANKIIGETIFLQKKFEAVYTLPKKEADKLSFKDLPYEFQSRLVALLPPSDCVSFKWAGKTANKYVKKRGQFSAFLVVVGSSSNYESMKSYFSEKSDYDFTSTSVFLKSDSWYIKNAMNLNFHSTKHFDRAVEMVSGTYHSLGLEGPYTWKHAIHFLNLSMELRDVVLRDGMLLEVEDFDSFFEAIVQYLKHQKNVIAIIIACPDLVAAFGNQLQEYVENQTTKKVMFDYGMAIICDLSALVSVNYA